MDTTKKSSEQVPFLERPIVRTILPIAGFVIICVLFAVLTDGRLFQPKNLSLLLSQSYMLLISSIGVFMVMTMGGLDFSQGSMLGVASIVVCWLSHYNMVLAALGGVVTGGLIGLINGYFNVKRKITSFIVTICTMYLFRGVCAYATTNSPVYAVSDISKYNTLPFMLTFTVIIFVAGISYLYIHRSWIQTQSDRCRRDSSEICRYPRRTHQDSYFHGSRMHHRSGSICKCDQGWICNIHSRKPA